MNKISVMSVHEQVNFVRANCTYFEQGASSSSWKLVVARDPRKPRWLSCWGSSLVLQFMVWISKYSVDYSHQLVL